MTTKTFQKRSKHFINWSYFCFYSFLCCPIMCLYFLSDFRVVMTVALSARRRCSVRLCLQLFIAGLMSYLHYLCLPAYSGLQHILCCVFILLFFVLLPVSLDCPFVVALSVFSNVYLLFLLFRLIPSSESIVVEVESRIFR